MTLHHKAMLDDLLDFLFTVVLAIFAFLFINGLLLSSTQARDDAALQKLAHLHLLEDAPFFFQAPLVFQGKEFTTAGFIQYCLAHPEVGEEFASIMDQQVTKAFHSTSSCGHRLRVLMKGSEVSHCESHRARQQDSQSCPRTVLTFSLGDDSKINLLVGDDDSASFPVGVVE